MVRESGLDWVIARPSKLDNRPASGRSVRTKALERVPTAISRAEVGHFLVDACERDEWVRAAVQLGG
jgi:hypothetical protein